MRFLKRWVGNDDDDNGKDGDWVVVAHATGPVDGEIIAGLLRTANIPYYIQQESIGRIYGLSFGALGMVTVLVPIDYEREAVALLDEPNLDDYPPQLDESPIKF